MTGRRLQLRITVIDPTRLGATADVLVAADPGTTLAEVSTALLAEIGCGPGILSCEGHPVPGSHRLGTPPLLEGAVLCRGVPGPRPEPGLLRLHAVAGPDAGRVASLPPGSHELGRAAEIRLADPDASRLHARLCLHGERATLADCDSRHGTWLSGGRSSGGRSSGGRLAGVADLAPGEPFRVGSSTLLLRAPSLTPAAITPDGLGHLLVNRRPHLPTPRAPVRVAFPVEPSGRPPARLPLLAMLLPLAVSLAVAAAVRQPLFLLFALTTPALMAGQWLADRRGGRRDLRARRVAFAGQLKEAEAGLASALRADEAQQEQRLPDLAHLLETATLPGADLWHRSSGVGESGGPTVRLGRGRAPSSVLRCVEPGGGGGGPVEQPVLHEDVAIGLDLAEHGVLGVCGPPEQRLAVARSLAGQLAVLYSPLDLHLEVVGGEKAWAWLGRLPHAGSPADGSRPVVVLDGAARLRRQPQVARWLAAARAERPAGTGPLLICLDDDATRLPAECAATLEIHGHRAPGAGCRATLHRAGHDPLELALDLPGPAWSERIGRALAPLRDATPVGGATSCPPLADLVAAVDGVAVQDPSSLARHWRRPGRSGPAATIGLAGRTPFRIDLRRDGPHLLVGGTTGSGKSELLLSLVAGLAIDGSPEDVAFLLIDYKGGAAFRGCLGLPHVAGVITDLNPHLARRAIASLRAELHRRERLLAAAGVADIDGYRSGCTPRPGGPPLPRLVVVVDEFRVLAEELPDFVDGLVRIAGVGRSLGVHLVLATQRPAGVVSPEIRANTALRIALRVRDPADSLDLIESPDAATIPAGSPGRAIARTGDGELIDFRVASIMAGRTRPEPPSVRRIDADPAPDPGPASGLSEQTGLAVVVGASRAAAALLGLAPVAPPWRPPLADRIALADLPAPAAADDLTAVLGLADLPSRQAQEPCLWVPARGHLAVLGGPRSGRTAALLAIGHGLAARFPPDRVHLYAIDAGGGLGSLSGLPHCGCVIPAGDTDRCLRLLARLADRVGAGRPERSGATGADPPVVVLVDGWETLSARWSGVDHGRPVDTLLALLRDGLRTGIHLAVAGGRSLLTGQVASLLPERLVLRFADPTDALLAGVPRLEGDQPAGRGLLTGAGHGDPVEVQVGLPAGLPIRAAAGTGGQGPWRLRELPARVSTSDLTAADHVPAPGLAVPIGVGGDEAGVVRLCLDRPGVTLVHGPPGSGRTTTLAAVAAGLRAAGVPGVVLGPSSAASDVPADPDAVLLLDDAARLTDPGLEQALLERARGGRPRLVLVAGPGEVATAYRGLLAEARVSRYGIMLGPLTPADAGVLDIGALQRPAGPPGRGLLVDGAVHTPVQVACG